ncbi:MAG TPA: HupE/UreJ family protein, partial [Opitutaceae bacterium]|nr:HupE/UreJ family protein [Opitutaceae bacterium]
DRPGMVGVKIDIDLTNTIGSPEGYYALTEAKPGPQRAAVDRLLPGVLDGLQLYVGSERLRLVLQRFSLPRLSQAEFLDPATDHFTTLDLVAVLPAGREPLRLIVPPGAIVDYPVAFIVQIPSAHISDTCWIEDTSTESDPFYWADDAPRAASAQASTAAAPRARGLDVDSMPWPRQLAMYLRLGFRHIVPEGTDHILFVLALFFLGITWRKLLSQTTVFTVAHATTLFLSIYGVFSLPSKYVEPAIALSIATIALENVFSPRLGIGRLAIVFSFGLIHGLGFASSLSEVPFPKHQFLVALLGFNFGVDAGQLFIILLAFLAVGWFRNRPWFRARVAIPCSLAIAAIGLFWAVQRIVYYRHLY